MGLTTSMKAFIAKLRKPQKQHPKRRHCHDNLSRSNVMSHRVKPASHTTVEYLEAHVAAGIVSDSKSKLPISKPAQQRQRVSKDSESSRSSPDILPSTKLYRMSSLPSLPLLPKQFFHSPRINPTSSSESPLSVAASNKSLPPPATSAAVKGWPSSDLPRCATSSRPLVPLSGPEANILRFLLVAALAIVTVFPPDVLVSLPPERRMPLGALLHLHSHTTSTNLQLQGRTAQILLHQHP